MLKRISCTIEVTILARTGATPAGVDADISRRLQAFSRNDDPNVRLLAASCLVGEVEDTTPEAVTEELGALVAVAAEVTEKLGADKVEVVLNPSRPVPPSINPNRHLN